MPTPAGAAEELRHFGGRVSASLLSMDLVPSSGWFAVRCLFRCGWPPAETADDSYRYEERITLWRAGDIDEAIVKAEVDAHDYAAAIEQAPSEYLGLAQAYALFDAPDHDGAEVFSLVRDSRLDSGSYLDTFFDAGQEHQRTTSDPPA